MEKNELKLVDERTVLGKDFRIYGTINSPLFLAKDVAEWIEHSNITMMLKSIDKDELIKLSPKDCLGLLTNNNEYNFLTEYGLYEVLMQSRKPIAKEFKKEVKQILKQIRLTGGYVAEDREAEFIENYFPSFTESTKLEMLNDLLKKNKELKPKADAYDDFLNANGYLSLNEVAKVLGEGQYKMMSFLRDNKVLFRKKNENLPYRPYESRGYFAIKWSIGRDGKTYGTTYVSPKGFDFIQRLYKKSEGTVA